MKRRNVLKGLLTTPVLGAIAYGTWKKRHYEKQLAAAKYEGITLELPEQINIQSDRSKKVRLGIIGFGHRGPDLLRAAGFANPDYIDNIREEAAINKEDKRYEDYLSQEDLGIEVTGICDVFDIRAENAIRASSNIYKEGKNGKFGKPAVRYKTYKELLASDDIDAVIIAAPDHWHATMTIEAAKHGKHVYVEKPMTWSIEEVYKVRDAVNQSGITFQLGHQGRQTDSYNVAKLAVEKGMIGKITLIEVTTNRNDPNGAWVYDIHPEASEKNIDWNQFLGQAPYHPFSLERFFRWRCWWDYGTGLNGDLLTHEFDCINQILNLGIPTSAMCSGGIYYFKDGRTVPDTEQVALEYADRDLTILYSATLGNGKQRGKVIMGHDASMELSDTLAIYPEQRSSIYGKRIEDGLLNPSVPMFNYIPGRNNVDVITSATEKYFASRGLLYTYRNGQRMDTTFLHIKEWIDAIRGACKTSCDIEQGFEEAVAAHMATNSYKTGRRIYWDKEKEKMVLGEKTA